MRQAPTDWLAIHASRLPKIDDDGGPPLPSELFAEFRAELEKLSVVKFTTRSARQNKWGASARWLVG